MSDHRGFLPSCYNRIVRLLATIEKNFGQTVPDGLDYGREALTRRLLQELVFLMDPPFRREDGARALRNQPWLIDDRPVFRCAGLIVDPVSGRVRPGLKLFIVSAGNFIALWLAILWFGMVALLGCGNGGTRRSGGTIVFGVPEEGLFRGDDSVFAEFARHGPIAPLNAARSLFVQTLTRGATSTDARIFYSRYPLFELLRKCPMGLADFLRLVARHLVVASRFFAGVARFPILVILWRDFGLQAAVASLNERGHIEAVVLTSSNWTRQLLCLTDLPHQRFDMHFVFYSQHDRPPAYIDIEDRCAAFPNMRLLRAHQFWLWTPGHVDFLVQAGVKGLMHVVGPIIWETVRRDSARDENAWISVFDITPLSDWANQEYGRLGNYYSTQNMLAFLDGIEEAVRTAGVRLPLAIKPKRNLTVLNDANYQSRLEKGEGFRKLDPLTSAASVVAKSAVIIVYPFSTAAYIADWLGKPAIYFDPTGRLAAIYEAGQHIRFARGTEELSAALRAIMTEKR